MSNPVLSRDQIRRLSEYSRLSLSEERCEALAQPLATLVAAANELSARVAANAGNPPSLPPMIGFPER